MTRAIPAAIFYVLGAFALGMLLGPLREFVLAPWTGPLLATLLELPLVLLWSWLLAGWIVGRMEVPLGGARWLMGGLALLLLLAMELALGRVLRGWDFAAWLAHLGTEPGLASLAGYLVFAALPALQRQP
ncbi:hypothetical protein [Sabulicella glaciei]|uniref:DUF4345 domain-containing protein n=1 Tax=Sabulicella glaciei TaxID=2984948 RepID=A0ABT3P054_9PROT|nr:hypothetical protein [Roseococcus sp. MDT2-1-1]MCW8087791.1 hypothetical protein [Roseococcus sp. MDT2-1-1]